MPTLTSCWERCSSRWASVQEAEVQFDKARRLKPGDWMVSDLIASARADSGDWEAAIRERREAVRQKPFFAIAHNALGFTLLGAGRADEAAQAFREALRKDPRFPPARVGLARALIARGEFVAAQQAIGRGEHGMPPLDHNLDPAAVAGKAERMIVLEARLPGLLRGESRPADAREAAEFAQLCFYKQQNAASARLWSEAFAARPALADEPGAENRLQAARAAALAGCGRSKDEPAAETAAPEAMAPAGSRLAECGTHGRGWSARERLAPRARRDSQTPGTLANRPGTRRQSATMRKSPRLPKTSGG